MKKIALTLAVLFALSGAAAIADDALVLPAGVIRITTAFSYAMADKEYDVDGEEQDMAAALTVMNVGAALEFGVNDWISAAVQWAPGFNVSSEFEDMDAKVNGPYDIFAGAKIQVVGPKAPVANEMFRFAFAPGVKIPLPGANFEDEVENVMNGDEFIAQDPDKHALGLGARLYADAVLTDMFFINLYSEFIYYLEKTDAEFMAFTPFPVVAKADLGYGYSLKLELDPHFEMMVSDGMKLSASVPATYTMTPDKEVDGEAQDDTASSSLNIGPNASMFFMKSPIPFELKLQYFLPLMGTNTQKLSTFSIQGKVYLKF
jgi:hypothetical protein